MPHCTAGLFILDSAQNDPNWIGFLLPEGILLPGLHQVMAMQEFKGRATSS
jgi:hypothetical protein